jgi:cysteine desulfurase/selenocysteine lyase
MPDDFATVHADFPMLDAGADGLRRIFLDNAATTQKSREAIARIGHFYAHENSHAQSTLVYAAARESVARFLGTDARQLIFLRGTSDAIALVADTWGRDHIGRDDEIVVSALEHQANLLPWQKLAASSGARLRVVPAGADGELSLDAFREHINGRTRLLAITHVSNVLGTIVPVQAIAAAAHAAGARILVDGAQAVAHFPVDVKALGVDFYAFSAHKVFGPTGVGALFVADGLMDRSALETGTSDIAGAAGLATALEMLRRIDPQAVSRHEAWLLQRLCDGLRRLPRVRLIGTAKAKVAIQSFVVDGMSPHAIKTALDTRHVEVQSGSFSAQHALAAFGVEAAVRASLAFYNTGQDVDAFLQALQSVAA